MRRHENERKEPKLNISDHLAGNQIYIYMYDMS